MKTYIVKIQKTADEYDEIMIDSNSEKDAWHKAIHPKWYMVIGIREYIKPEILK